MTDVTAETAELMDLDIFEVKEAEILPTGTYTVTIKNAIWKEEKGYMLLFLTPEVEGKNPGDIEDVAEMLSFPNSNDPNRTVRFKQQRLQAWVLGTGLPVRNTSELSDPEVWKGLGASVELVTESSEEYGTQNKVQSVHAQ